MGDTQRICRVGDVFWGEGVLLVKSPANLFNPLWLDDSGNPITEGNPRELSEKPVLSVDCSPKINEGVEVLFSLFRTGSNTLWEEIQAVNLSSANGGSRRAQAKWAYHYTDDDYDKSTEFTFEARSEDHRLREKSGEFDTGWFFLTESQISGGEDFLQQPFISVPFSFEALMNGKTDKLVEIILNNVRSLDEDSRTYIECMTAKERELKAILDSLTVWTGIVEDDVDIMFDQLNIPNIFMDTKMDALCLGDSIYVKHTIHMPPNGVFERLNQRSTVEFLVHEAVHSIQAKAFGLSENRNIPEEERRARFVTYCLNNQYDDTNPYEVAAYKFGGRIDTGAFRSLKGFNQILAKPENTEWWI